MLHQVSLCTRSRPGAIKQLKQKEELAAGITLSPCWRLGQARRLPGCKSVPSVIRGWPKREAKRAGIRLKSILPSAQRHAWRIAASRGTDPRAHPKLIARSPDMTGERASHSAENVERRFTYAAVAGSSAGTAAARGSLSEISLSEPRDRSTTERSRSRHRASSPPAWQLNSCR